MKEIPENPITVPYRNKRNELVSVPKFTLNGYTTEWNKDKGCFQYRQASKYIDRLASRGIRVGKLWHE